MMKQYRSKKAAQNILSTYNALVRAWGVAVDEMDLPTRYGSTHILCAGDASARPVVLFHGVGDDSALMWLLNAKALSEQFRIYAVDTIGGPGKSVPDERYDKDFDDVLWIDDIFDGLGLECADLIGVSHGGYLAQLYTVERPERVGKAAAIASAVAAGEKNGSPMKTMMKIFLPEALFPTDRNIRKLLCKLSGKHADVFTENALIAEHYKWLLRGFNNMSMAFHKVRTFQGEELDLLRDRVLFLVGEEDPFEKLGGKAALIENRMTAVFYPDAGHGLNHELADEINAKLLSLLNG